MERVRHDHSAKRCQNRARRGVPVRTSARTPWGSAPPAGSGGGFSMEAGNPLLDDYVLGLTGASRPKVCWISNSVRGPSHSVANSAARWRKPWAM